MGRKQEISRRSFLDTTGKVALAGMSAAAMPTRPPHDRVGLAAAGGARAERGNWRLTAGTTRRSSIGR